MESRGHMDGTAGLLYIVMQNTWYKFTEIAGENTGNNRIVFPVSGAQIE